MVKKNGTEKVLNDEIVRTHFIEEMADVLMYFNDVLLCCGVTPEEFAAVYRKKHKCIGEFHKEIHIGKKVFAVEHTKEGGGASWMFASYRENQ